MIVTWNASVEKIVSYHCIVPRMDKNPTSSLNSSIKALIVQMFCDSMS